MGVVFPEPELPISSMFGAGCPTRCFTMATDSSRMASSCPTTVLLSASNTSRGRRGKESMSPSLLRIGERLSIIGAGETRECVRTEVTQITEGEPALMSDDPLRLELFTPLIGSTFRIQFTDGVIDLQLE